MIYVYVYALYMGVFRHLHSRTGVLGSMSIKHLKRCGIFLIALHMIYSLTYPILVALAPFVDLKPRST